jgi:hypothetical protein
MAKQHYNSAEADFQNGAMSVLLFFMSIKTATTIIWEGCDCSALCLLNM